MQEKAGFVPNVFLAWAHRPDEFRAFFAYHDALLEKPGGLTKAEREMIVVVTSSVNHCHYCVIAHGAILRVRAKNPLVADQVAINYLNAELTPRQRAMLDFAVKMTRAPYKHTKDDIEKLRGVGFNDTAILQITLIAAYFNYINRVADALGVGKPDGEGA